MSQEHKETIFADGFYFKRPATLPDYVVGKLDIELTQAIPFLKKHAKRTNVKNRQGEPEEKFYVNLEVKIGKSGNPYIVVDTWDAKKELSDHLATKKKPIAELTAEDEELPF